MKNLLVTGGAGFIGSNFARYMLEKYPHYKIVVFDKLTYAGNLDNLRDVASSPRYAFVQGDICSADEVQGAIRAHAIDTIVNFAAETHVDRSILDADAFLRTNVVGTFVLLEAAKQFGLERYHQISTDEVYGWVDKPAHEDDPLIPRSPYAAAKASGDLMVNAYYVTHHVPTTITRASNTVGPYQYPEKVVPLFITNALENEPLPLYGDGKQIRDWLYVTDHCEAVDVVLHQGKVGEVYNVGGDNERHNVEVVKLILDTLDKSPDLVRRVADRSGHDRRYSLGIEKIEQLGWKPRHSFEGALTETIHWYAENKWWWQKIKSGDYREYYERQYGERLRTSEAITV
ncbi:MAG: dTDP-glucose 4,6-dehydratase [Anaerolineae bacterium]|nr:dTDP-glucose 4,6-dehydratase [Anaerolineae bacterium]